jgi:hypothetical protein
VRATIFKSLCDTTDLNQHFGQTFIADELTVSDKIHSTYINIFLQNITKCFKDDAMSVSFSVKVEGWNISLVLHQLPNSLMKSHKTSPTLNHALHTNSKWRNSSLSKVLQMLAYLFSLFWGLFSIEENTFYNPLACTINLFMAVIHTVV